MMTFESEGLAWHLANQKKHAYLLLLAGTPKRPIEASGQRAWRQIRPVHGSCQSDLATTYGILDECYRLPTGFLECSTTLLLRRSLFNASVLLLDEETILEDRLLISLEMIVSSVSEANALVCIKC